nr:HNH endonuclease [Agromyces aureus]
MRQYRRQGYVCAYCEAPCSGLPEPEHVVPLSRGGRNDMTNLVAACRTCNSDKNDMTLNEWQTDRARRGLMPVRIDGDAFTHLVPEVNTPTGTAYRHRDAA